jgi:serine/threonine-protein kinase
VAGLEVDPRADLWSLAVVAFECVTGQLPFRADALRDLFAEIQRAPLPVPSRVDPGCPSAFDAWWARAASRNLPDRFPSAPALVHALGRALGVIEPQPEVRALPARARPLGGARLLVAGLALALAPVAGKVLADRIYANARPRHAAPPASPRVDLAAAAGGSASPPQPVELAGLPDLAEDEARTPPDGPAPVRAPAAIKRANKPSRPRPPARAGEPEGSSPTDNLDFGF